MRTLPVVFEDAGWRGLRPLADSTPTFEIRCGLFNLRERIDLIRRDLGNGPGTEPAGFLLMRPVLRDLSTATAWSCTGRAAFPESDQQHRYAWLNGRLGLCDTLLERVLATDQPAGEFALVCGETLVAGVVERARHDRLQTVWSDWCDGGAGTTGPDLAATDLWSGLQRSDLPGGVVPAGWRRGAARLPAGDPRRRIAPTLRLDLADRTGDRRCPGVRSGSLSTSRRPPARALRTGLGRRHRNRSLGRADGAPYRRVRRPGRSGGRRGGDRRRWPLAGT